MAEDALLHPRRKHDAIDGERAAAGNARLVCRLQHDAPKLAHLGLEQAVRVRRFYRFEGVATDQLGEAIGLMRRRHADRAHLVEVHADPALGQRPGGFTTREPAADDGHGRTLLRPYETTSSASGADSSTRISWPHLRHLRVVSPVVLDLISSIPTKPQLGQGTATGLFQVE